MKINPSCTDRGGQKRPQIDRSGPKGRKARSIKMVLSRPSCPEPTWPFKLEDKAVLIGPKMCQIGQKGQKARLHERAKARAWPNPFFKQKSAK